MRPTGSGSRRTPVDGFVYNLPQELIANTIKAFATDATTPTGRPICTGSNAATCGGPDRDQAIHRSTEYDRVRGVRRRRLRRTPAVDQGAAVQPLRPQLQEAVSVRGRASFDLQADLLNVFNAINYISVFSTATNPDSYRVTTAYADINNTYDPGGRITQLVFRLNW